MAITKSNAKLKNIHKLHYVRKKRIYRWADQIFNQRLTIFDHNNKIHLENESVGFYKNETV